MKKKLRQHFDSGREEKLGVGAEVSSPLFPTLLMKLSSRDRPQTDNFQR